MKLGNVIHEGRVNDLSRQYVVASNDNNMEEAEKVKGLLASQLLAIGWDRVQAVRFLSELETVGTEKNLYVFLSKYKAINEESPADPINTFVANIAVPMIDKGQVKGSVKSLENYLKKKGIKIIKAKAQPTASFSLGADSQGAQSIIDVEVDITFKTRMSRDELYDVIEPKYELITIEEK
jgi:hypothetical protein